LDKSKTILVTGAGGQLGNQFRMMAALYPQYHFLFTDKEILAIDNADAVKKYFTHHSIDYCINCAAYTAVDKAETEKEKAFLINATAAGNLSAVCKAHNILLIHISTDYVFDGSGTKPYTETDAIKPINVYGQSKQKGEELVLQQNPSAIIIRTSWVYAAFGNNFVNTILRLMKERESINVVNDQYGSPTYAADLAAAILEIIGKHSSIHFQSSVFNYCNEGIISWYNFAAAIKEITQSACIINAIPGTQYPTPAKRPHYSVLDTSLIKNTFGIIIPGWRESLEKCLKQ
jgi:dTDP-4-dehydrorhamnose reductase